MAIPKIIHQVWGGPNNPPLPERLQILSESWKEENPDWEYHLWTEKEMDKLVETHFPKYLSFYKDLPYDIQRWDTIRYMILFLYGGVYVDLDSECFHSINPLMENVKIGFGEEPPFHEGSMVRIGNAFMASEQENASWLTILDEICQNYTARSSIVDTVLHTTGPNMIHRIFPRLQKIYGAIAFPYSQVAPVSKKEVYEFLFLGKEEPFLQKVNKAYCVHYFFGSWDDSIALYDDNEEKE